MYNYLCKLWLSIVPSALVSVTSGDLKVSIQATYHEKLLELLRTLYQ